MQRWWTKLLSFFFATLLVSGFFAGLASPIQAAQDKVDKKFSVSGSTFKTQLKEFITEASDETTNNRKSFSAGVGTDGMFTVMCLTAGCADGDTTELGLTETQKQAAAEKFGQGAIPSITNYISDLYNPPVSSQTYLADIFHSARLIPQAQAQGIGFAALDPILNTWKAFRNVAYLFFVIVFLVIGFMIMFRHKISGQTVVTAQQAIPNVIVSLIFVTFSYAIAGFLIDLMYLVMFFAINLFSGTSDILNDNFLELGIKFVKAGASGAFSSVNEAIKEIVSVAVLDEVVGFASGLTVAVIIAVAVLIGVFKIFWELLKSYISIIINVIFAPITLMIGAIPGQNVFWPWLQQLIGNLSAFPMVLLLLLVQKTITAIDIEAGGFMPPFLLPTGSGTGNAIIGVIGVGMLLVTPEIVKKVKEMLGVKDGVLFDFAKTAYERYQKGVPYGTLPWKAAIGGGAGALAGNFAANRTHAFSPQAGMLGGAFLGTFGPKKGASMAGGALNKYGEFIENMNAVGIDAATPVERTIGTLFPGLQDQIAKMRRTRHAQGKVPAPAIDWSRGRSGIPASQPINDQIPAENGNTNVVTPGGRQAVNDLGNGPRPSNRGAIPVNEE